MVEVTALVKSNEESASRQGSPLRPSPPLLSAPFPFRCLGKRVFGEDENEHRIGFSRLLKRGHIDTSFYFLS